MKKSIAATRTASAAALALSLAFAGGAAAQADPIGYPAPEVSLALSAGGLQAGESLTVSGTGLKPHEEVTISVSRNRSPNKPPVLTRTTTADATGEFSAEVSFAKPGRHWLSVAGDGTGSVGTASVVVTGPPAGAGSTRQDQAGSGRGELEAERSAAVSAVLPDSWGIAGLGLLATAGAGALVLRRRHG